MAGRSVEWLPRAALDRMHADLALHAEITHAQLADKIIENAAPVAAYSVVDLAASAEDEAVRLKAAAYVLDRVNGKPRTTIALNTTPDNPVLKVMQGVVVERGGQMDRSSDQPGYAEYVQTPSPYPASTVPVVDQEPFAPPIPED